MTTEISPTVAEQLIAAVDMKRSGATFSKYGRPLPESGYLVGGHVPGLVNPTPDEIRDWLASHSCDFVGMWTSANGDVYVDASTHIQVRKLAIMIARKRREIALWDILAGQEIRSAE